MHAVIRKIQLFTPNIYIQNFCCTSLAMPSEALLEPAPPPSSTPIVKDSTQIVPLSFHVLEPDGRRDTDDAVCRLTGLDRRLLSTMSTMSTMSFRPEIVFTSPIVAGFDSAERCQMVSDEWRVETD